MRCVDCGLNEATIVLIQGTGGYTNVRREGDLEATDSPGPSEAPEPGSAAEDEPRGPNVCATCAQRRYEARGAVMPWEQFRRLFMRGT